MELTSRIHKFIPRDCMKELYDVAMDVFESDNGIKADRMAAILRKYEVPFRELGPGTNRYAVTIDGYVFKIAFDKQGIRDNYIEFAVGGEAYKFVTKTYECNGLIVVAEYVTVIDEAAFTMEGTKEAVLAILAELTEHYLVGDVGCIKKNFLNWGYRSNDELCILDYGFVYPILGHEMICSKIGKDGKACQTQLEYNDTYSRLKCPRCGNAPTFIDIRSRLDPKFEKNLHDEAKDDCYLMTSETMTVSNSNLKVASSIFDMGESSNNREENETMYDEEEIKETSVEMTEEEEMALYNKAVEDYQKFLKTPKEQRPPVACDCDDEEEEPEEVYDTETDDEAEDEPKESTGLVFGFRYNDLSCYYEPTELEYVLAELFGKDVIFCTDVIADVDVPDGFYKYELRRDAEEDIPAEIGKKILNLRFGMILSPEKIPELDARFTIPLKNKDLRLTGKYFTYDEITSYFLGTGDIKEEAVLQIDSSDEDDNLDIVCDFGDDSDEDSDDITVVVDDDSSSDDEHDDESDCSVTVVDDDDEQEETKTQEKPRKPSMRITFDDDDDDPDDDDPDDDDDDDYNWLPDDDDEDGLENTERTTETGSSNEEPSTEKNGAHPSVCDKVGDPWSSQDTDPAIQPRNEARVSGETADCVDASEDNASEQLCGTASHTEPDCDYSDSLDESKLRHKLSDLVNDDSDDGHDDSEYHDPAFDAAMELFAAREAEEREADESLSDAVDDDDSDEDLVKDLESKVESSVTSYTSWNEPSSEKDIASVLDEEEAEERNRLSSKRHKHNKHYK